MKNCLQKLAQQEKLQIHVECVDIRPPNPVDLSLQQPREALLQRIRSREFDAVLLSPPCSTFSRAAWQNYKGPRPVRSYEWPRGCQILTAAERDRAILGNIFADLAWEVAELVAQGAASFLVFEQPEDLGAIKRGPRRGGRPASMWQRPELHACLDRGLRSVAFHQSSFGTSYPKPTRLLLKTNAALPQFCYEALPSFDDQGYYLGPLPLPEVPPMQTRTADGQFATRSTAVWPPRLCQWLAQLLVQTVLASGAATPAGRGDEAARCGPDEKISYHICEPEGHRLQGGQGEPRGSYVQGRLRPFHDGGGLCSPGRWPLERRSHAEGAAWQELRLRIRRAVLRRMRSEKELEREAFRMAAGGENGCAMARDETLQEEIRDILAEWLQEQGLEDPKVLDVAPGQPLRLRLIRGLLEAAGDPDREFLLRAEEGLPLGILEPLPRTPHVFEEQVKWPLDNSPWEPVLSWVPNYHSVKDHESYVREKFEEDVAEGLMERMSLRDFQERYGEDRAIAALAVIVEDETTGKKRVIHDASHGVRVNHRIKCRDKIRAPGAREKKMLLREMKAKKKTAFSVVGDISKAHRRYKHQASEHGFMGCQVDDKEELEGDPGSQSVYVNKVGTFGLSPASYWWTRIAACGLRLTHHLMGPDYELELLLYADDLEVLGMGAKGRQGIPMCYLLLASVGFPFKWAKTRGGFRVEWLGLETEYVSYKLGLSKKRADWLVDWLRAKVKDGYVGAVEMAQGLGRLGFAATALDWERPFLGPLHAWSSAVAGEPGKLTLPTMLRVLMEWLAERLGGRERLQQPESVVYHAQTLSFFTDAKAEDGRAWVGGFLELVPGCSGPWFSLEVKRDWAPWAFAKEDPNKVIAALELLGTLVAVTLWVPQDETRKATRVALRGYTDNKSNEALLKKVMTTKFPSMLILMELAEELASRNCDLQLQWIRRDLNQLADDLTNENFASFDPAFRIHLRGEELEWKILGKLLGHAESYYEEPNLRKRARPRKGGRFGQKRRKLDPW